MYNNTIRALDIILNEEYNPKNPRISLCEYASGNQLITVKKNETIIYQKDPLKYFYFLLSGRLCVLNHITWNSDNVIDYLEPLDILGLVEYLCGVPRYTAFVVAETKCVLFRIPIETFTEIIQQNASLCYQTLLTLGKITSSNMDRAETNALFHSRDILGHYLFLQAQHKVPYVCPLTRKVLSEKLHINLRTLYRHIDHFQSNGYLRLQRGKIIIESEHLSKLAARYGDVIL